MKAITIRRYSIVLSVCAQIMLITSLAIASLEPFISLFSTVALCALSAAILSSNQFTSILKAVFMVSLPIPLALASGISFVFLLKTISSGFSRSEALEALLLFFQSIHGIFNGLSHILLPLAGALFCVKIYMHHQYVRAKK